MMATPAKVFNLDGNGHARVSLAANSDLETTLIDNPNPSAVPPGALSARRRLVIAFPTDTVPLGDSGVTHLTGYGTRGRNGGTNWQRQSARDVYSNRKQFLRGQYASLPISDDLTVYARIPGGALEQIVAFELA